MLVILQQLPDLFFLVIIISLSATLLFKTDNNGAFN